MCLIIDEKATAAMRKRLAASESGQVLCWKAYKRFFDVRKSEEVLSSPCYRGRRGSRVAKAGPVISTRRQCSYCRGTKLISRGIHVLLLRSEALGAYFGDDIVVVPVYCKQKHFVAAGTTEAYPHDSSAVFTQVRITDHAFRKALKT